MKNPLRYLGFLGFFSLLGLRYFQTGEWPYLLFFGWVLWFAWFFPGFRGHAYLNQDQKKRQKNV